MRSNEGLAWTRVSDVLVIVHAPRPATDTEWDEMMADPVTQDARAMLVVSNGVRPSPRQRAEIQDRFGKLPTAVLTDSGITRGAITALSWFGMPIQAFTPSNQRSAFDYLELPPDTAEQMPALLHDMNASVAPRR